MDVEPGDDVVIVGQQGSERLDVREIAATIGAIPWELLCRVGSRIERVYAGPGTGGAGRGGIEADRQSGTGAPARSQ